MEEEKKHIDELIATYLTEGLDKNALAELKAWIAASPENKNYFIQQREVWFSAVSREAASKYNKDKAFDTFKKRIGNRKEIEKTSHHGFRCQCCGVMQRLLQSYLQSAASLIGRGE